jgi:hypothetical protein
LKTAIQLSQWGSVKSFTSNRKAHCNNCSQLVGSEMVQTPILPGEKRITLTMGFNRTLYLCAECAEFQVECLESLVSDLKRAISGWIDTEAEWYTRRDASIASENARSA